MQRLLKPVLFGCLLFAAILLNGCMDKTFFPAAELEVISVEPFASIPTSADVNSVPETQVTVRSLGKIPASLKKISLRYYTVFGDEISSIAVNDLPIEARIGAEEELTIDIRPYTVAVADIFELSSSQISPIKAKITLHFNDVNGNWVNREAHCLLYKFEAAAEPDANRRAG
jgi:hypothetical protein